MTQPPREPAPSEPTAETVCIACGKPWDGEKCGQADNGHPFAVCEPITRAASPTPDPREDALAKGIALAVAAIDDELRMARDCGAGATVLALNAIKRDIAARVATLPAPSEPTAEGQDGRLQAEADALCHRLGVQGRRYSLSDDKIPTAHEVLELALAAAEQRGGEEAAQGWRDLALDWKKQADTLRADLARMKAAMEWYADKVSKCRMNHSEGDEARRELDRDCGERAAAALKGTSP